MSERHVTFDMIVQAVGAVSGLSRREIMANGRTTDGRAQARYACWWLVEKMTELGPGHHWSALGQPRSLDDHRRPAPG
jgi:hypothetical protein